MSIRIDIEEYIKKLLEYSKSDVGYLLKEFKSNDEDPHAGPVLLTIMSGIDALGGVVYGFCKHNRRGKPIYNNGKPIDNSEDRSVKFMFEYMNISKRLAKFIYDSVRCGLVHLGMPKNSVEYELLNDDSWKEIASDSNNAFCRDDSEKQIYINVAKLAESYLLAIKNIEDEFTKDPHSFMALGLKNIVDKSYNSFNDAFNSVSAKKISYGMPSTSASTSNTSSSTLPDKDSIIADPSGSIPRSKPKKPTPGEMP